MSTHKIVLALLASAALACGSDGSASTSLGEGRHAIATTIFSEDSHVANIDFENQRTTLLVPQEDGELRAGLEMVGFPYGLIALE